MSNKLTIKKSNLENQNFYFSNESEDLCLEKKVINFVYANNGTGKTTIYHKLLADHKKNFYPLMLNKNTFLDEKHKLVISLNLDEIKKLKNENENIRLRIQEEIKQWINDGKFSTGNGTIWKLHIQPYLKFRYEKIVFLTNELVKNINENKKFEIDLEKIQILNNELKFFSEEPSDIDTNFLTTIMSNNPKITSKEIIESSRKILKYFESLEQQFLQIIENTTICNMSIDVKLLSCITNCLDGTSLKKMDNCYLCKQISNESLNVIDLKNELNQEIEEVKKCSQLEPIFDDITKFDEVFSTKLNDLLLPVNYTNIIKCREIIEETIKKFENAIEKNIFNLKKIFKEKDVETITENISNIRALKRHQRLVKLKEEDFNIARQIIFDTVGENKIKIDKDSENVIEVTGMDGDDLPVSSGEQKLVRFILNLFIYVSVREKNEGDQNNFLIIDDPEELFDELNKIRVSYIINKYSNLYKVNFLIFTNKHWLIRELYEVSPNNIALTLFFKDTENKRLFKRTANGGKGNNEIQFMGLKTGLKLLKETINEDLAKSNNYDKTIVLVYLCWLLRINGLIFGSRLQGSELLKYWFLLISNDKSDTESKFNQLLEEIKVFGITFENPIILFNDFMDIINSIKTNLQKVEINIFEKFPIVKNNIVNLIKILFLREKIRMFIDSKMNNKSINGYRKKIQKLINENYNNPLVREKYKTIQFILSFLDCFYHNEVSPSLLMNGIELNKTFVDSLIDKTEKIINFL